jgi:hypothetical protein
MENLPDDKTFDVSAVKILMRLAYQEGQERERCRVKEENRKPEGPYEIL